MGEPCEGRTTHHAGCACHEARRDAQLAAVTAERDALRAEHTADCGLIAKQFAILTAVADELKGTPPALSSHSHHDLGAVAAATVAQQAPLVACVDALRAAATAAGWRDADATGETLVAWVRRGGAREGAEAVFAAALRTEGVEARERIRQVAALRGLGWLSVDADECGDEDSVCAAQSIAAKIRGREGGE